MNNGPCKNHPHRAARRRCFSCGAFICPDCQIRGARHYFCSPRCQLQFQLGEAGNNVLELLQTVLPSLPLSSKKGSLGKIIAGAGLLLFVMPLLALIFVIYLNFRTQARIGELEDRLKNFVAAPASTPMSTPATGKVRVHRPVNGTTLSTKHFDLEGEGDANAVISLSKNGRLLSATAPNGGRFVFSQIELESGENRFDINAISLDGGVVGSEKLILHYRARSLPPAFDFTRGDRNLRKIALTFDGGSTDNAAGPILEILRQQNLQATIFLTGEFIRKFPDMTRRIVEEGHEVGNHSWSHPHLTSFATDHQHLTLPDISREALHQELSKTAELFAQVTGKRMGMLWRAPYGEQNEEIRGWAAELGYRHIGWTVGRSADESMDTMDWVSDTTSTAYHSAEEILQRLLRIANGTGDAANGGIVLMHLGSQRHGDEPFRILPQLIQELRAKEYEIVTVSQLLD